VLFRSEPDASNRPDELRTYLDLLKKADFYYYRAESTSKTERSRIDHLGRNGRKRLFDKADTYYERAIERLNEIFESCDGQTLNDVLLHLDRPWKLGDDPNLGPNHMPRVRNSRSRFSDSQSGYSLSFGGGTANITDPIIPNLLKARAACDGSSVSVKLNKKMKCSSLASNGSDFSISPTIAPITSAVGIGCSTGFDMDSVVLTLAGRVPPGNYTIYVQTGTDGNNLLDNCDRGFAAGQSLPVTVYPLTPTAMDSISKIGCAPKYLELVFKDPMFCNSIAADGSDFIITGPYPISISGASGICNSNGFAQIVRVNLSTSIQKAGTFQIILKNGTDGNTIINECGVPTIVGSMLQFNSIDTVSAYFNTNIKYGCLSDTIYYLHDDKNYHQMV
jgi:hypothetical protein